MAAPPPSGSGSSSAPPSGPVSPSGNSGAPKPLVTAAAGTASPRPGKRPKKRSANQLLIGGLVGCAGVVMFVVIATKLLSKPPPPPPPPPLPSPERSVNATIRFNASYFQALLNEDSKRYGLKPAPTIEELAKPLAYTDELPTPRRLKGREKVVTPHLTLGTKVIKEWASTGSGERFRFEHLVLTITNTSATPLAYRVETAIDNPEHCSSKGSLAHNAIAIAPGETVERTECLYHPRDQLTLKKVETLALTPLGYRYVSRLIPTQVLLDDRTSAGHEAPPLVKPCQFVPWRDIQAAVGKGGTGWGDVMDFYARHNCDEYSFYEGYHRWTAPGSLPSHAL